jgi:type I restriction enzyme S subunit
VYNKKTVIVPDDIEIGIGSTELYAIRPKEDVDKLYLLWMLRSDETIEQIEGKLTGSTGRQRLSETDLEDILIPDPSDDKKTEIITLVNIMERQINDLNNKIKQIQKDTKQKIFTIIKE